jgi:hypothetical protein
VDKILGSRKDSFLAPRRPFLTSRYIFNAYGSRAIDSTLFCSRICAGSSSKATESNVVTTFDVAKPFRSGQAQPMYRNTGQSCRIAFSPVFWLPMEISVADTAPNMIMSSVWYSRHECETTIGFRIFQKISLTNTGQNVAAGPVFHNARTIYWQRFALAGARSWGRGSDFKMV